MSTRYAPAVTAAMRALGTRLSVLLDPVELLKVAGIKNPDEWQIRALTTTSRRVLLLLHRQGGKSTCVSVKALHVALSTAGALVLICAPTQRQSSELFRKVLHAYRQFRDDAGITKMDRVKVSREILKHQDPLDVQRESALQLELMNGSRIVALPGRHPDNIRAYSGPALIVIDEAAMCLNDDLYSVILPMLLVSRGALWMLTTPKRKRGFFYAQWKRGKNWERFQVPITANPRFTPEQIAEVKEDCLTNGNGLRDWLCEYMTEFIDEEGSIFREEDINALFIDTDAFSQEMGEEPW